jgi:transposase
LGKRNYQHVQNLLPEIKELLAQGMTQAEAAKELGLTGTRPIHKLLGRERKKDLQGIPKTRGRKPAKTLTEYKYENKRLKMENELLRDFLRLTERGSGQS